MVEHPLLVQQRVPVTWKIADLDLMALANKYWVHGWSYERLGEHFGLVTNTARRRIIRIRVDAKNGVEPWCTALQEWSNSKSMKN